MYPPRVVSTIDFRIFPPLSSLPKSVGRYENEAEDPREAFTYR